MTGRRKVALVIFLALLVVGTSLFGSVHITSAQGGINPEALTIVLIIDKSYSMQHTDPHTLRETAAHIFIDLLSFDDYLEILTFDDEVETVVPLQQILASGNKESIKAVLSSYLEHRGHTDYKKAFEKALETIKKTDLKGTRPVVVFLTDGDVNPDSAFSEDAAYRGEYMDSLWEIIRNYSQEGISIYSVGFSDEINPEIIKRISDNTRGEYYFLNEPAEIAATFFELLGSLKNRRSIINTSYNLREKPERIKLQIDEYTRQVNLVVLNTYGGKCELSLSGPGGTAAGGRGITLNNEENYSLAAVHHSDESYRGEWEAVLSGRGTVKVLADMDYFVKAWLAEPAPFSQLPINEPMNFKVILTRGDEMRDRPLKLDVLLTRPGAQVPVTIPLVEEDGYFTGSYSQVDKAGTYEITTRVLLEDQVVSTSSSKVYVKMLPTLTTDFWVEEGYRRGEEQIITASLNVAGKRVPEGPDLKVEIFNLIIKYEDGHRFTLPLYDSGDTEHGDVRADDGIRSNRFTFDREGPAQALLLAAGKYRGSEYLLEKNLGNFEVKAPGRVILSLPLDKYFSVPGRRLSFPVKIQNDSSFKEILLIEQDTPLGSFVQSIIAMDPGENRNVYLDINLDSDLEIKNYKVPLVFTTDHGLTRIEPSGLEIQVEVTTPIKAALLRISPFLSVIAVILIILLAAGFIVYFGGILLYRFLVLPRTRLVGSLEYWKTDTDNILEGRRTGELKLGVKGKDTIIISFDANDKTADFRIEDSSYLHSLIIKTEWNNPHPRFIQGWKALRQKHVPLITTVRCTQPGIIEYNGDVYTQKDLLHEDEFESGGYAFRYVNPYGRWFKEKGEGVNLLNGKI